MSERYPKDNGPPRDPGMVRYGGGDLMLILMAAVILSLIALVIVFVTPASADEGQPLQAGHCTLGNPPQCFYDTITGDSGTMTMATTAADDEDLPIALTDLVKAAAVIRFETRNEREGIAEAIERAAAVLEKCARSASDGQTKANACEVLK